MCMWSIEYVLYFSRIFFSSFYSSSFLLQFYSLQNARSFRRHRNKSDPCISYSSNFLHSTNDNAFYRAYDSTPAPSLSLSLFRRKKQLSSYYAIILNWPKSTSKGQNNSNKWNSSDSWDYIAFQYDSPFYFYSFLLFFFCYQDWVTISLILRYHKERKKKISRFLWIFILKASPTRTK